MMRRIVRVVIVAFVAIVPLTSCTNSDKKAAPQGGGVAAPKDTPVHSVAPPKIAGLFDAEKLTENDKAVQSALQKVEDKKGAASNAEFDELIEAIDKLDAAGDGTDNFKYPTRAGIFIERTVREIARSAEAALISGKKSTVAQAAVQKLKERRIIERAGSQGALSQQLLERLQAFASSVDGLPKTSDQEKQWIKEETQKFAKKLAPALGNITAPPKDAPKEVQELYNEAAKIEEIVDKEKKLSPAVVKAISQLPERVKNIKKQIDTIKDPVKKAELAKSSENALLKVGALGVKLVSLGANWNDLSDIEKVRDIVSATADALETLQLALATAVPEKLIIAAILRFLAELLDFGINLFGGSRPSGGSDRKVEDRKPEGGGGVIEPHIDKTPKIDSGPLGDRSLDELKKALGGSDQKQAEKKLNEWKDKAEKELAAKGSKNAKQDAEALAKVVRENAKSSNAEFRNAVRQTFNKRVAELLRKQS